MLARKKSFFKLLPAIFFLLTTLAVMADSGRLVDATKIGALGDGATVNTTAIQKAIDACSADGGGTIQFPAGRYVTGTIQLKDNVTLHLDANAVLLGSTNAADYRNVDPFIAGDGIALGYALIVAEGANHVGVEGAGTIDGRGRELKAAQSRYTTRPFLMRWLHCTNVTVKDVHLTNPGAWTVNFFQSRNATVEHVTIRTRNTGLVNNDGIDLDSCENVSIRDCDIDSGDDAICIKTTSPLPCRDITASGCKLSTKCNAIKLGTESLGDFENISVTDCQIRDTGMAGIALYCVDGGYMQDVNLSGITMDGVTVPVSVRLGARLKTFRTGDQPKPPGVLRDVTIKNVRVTGARQIGLLINGITNHPVENLTLENIQIELAGGGKLAGAQIQLPEKESAYPEYSMFGKTMPAYGIYARHVRGITFKNVQTTVKNPDARPAAIFIDVKDAAPADYASISVNSK
jgi:polygalacturonase